MTRIEIQRVKRDGATQARAMTSTDKVHEYAALMAPDDGGDPVAFPPIVVFFDGTNHWLADGFHRVAAAEMVDHVDIDADIRAGTRLDAVWHAAGCNATHGLAMSPADRKRALKMLLAVDAHASNPDHVLAAHVGVSVSTVRRARRDEGVSKDTRDVDGRARVAQVLEAADIAGEALSQREAAERAGVSRKVARAVMEAAPDDVGPGVQVTNRAQHDHADDPVVVPDGVPEQVADALDIGLRGRALARDMRATVRRFKAELDALRRAVWRQGGGGHEWADFLPSDEGVEALESAALSLESGAPSAVCGKCKGRAGACGECGGRGWVTR